MKIAFVLQSPDVTAAQLRKIAIAIAVQMGRDVAPAWGVAAPDVDTTIYASVNDVPADACPIVLLLSSDAANALGYHDELIGGRPYARVFTFGLSLDEISEVCSHEAGEMLVDPRCNCYDRGVDGRLYAREPFDATEGQPYWIDGVAVANFVLPAWCDINALEGVKVDFLGLLPGPGTKSPGGYIIVQGVNGAIATEPASAALRESKLHPASRCAKRHTGTTHA